MKFRVRIYGFKGIDLAAKDSDGFSDPYLKCDFDSFKKFKTDVIKKNLNPEWDFDLTFYYKTMYPEKLHRKVFKIKCIDKDILSKDDLIGEASVDLHTIATGPVQHELPIWKYGKPGGRIRFNIVMEELATVTAFLNGVCCSDLPEVGGTLPDVQLEATHSEPDNQHTIKSKVIKSSSYPEWDMLEQLRFTCTLQEAFKSAIHIAIFDTSRKRTFLGRAAIPLQQYHTFTAGQNVKFKVPVELSSEFLNQGRSSAIEGNIYFKEFPRFAQMVGGIHTEHGIRYGRLFCDGVEKPNITMIDTEETKSNDMSLQSSAAAAPPPPSSSAAAAAAPAPPRSIAQAPPPRQSPPSHVYPTIPSPAIAHQQQQQQQLPPGIAGYCIVCGKPADFVCKDTKDPVCGKQCKIANLGKKTFQQVQGTPTHSSMQASAPSPSPVSSSAPMYQSNPYQAKAPVLSVPSPQPVHNRNPSGLPPGWEMRLDPNTGRKFYVDNINKKTQWEPPTSSASAPPPVPPRQSRAQPQVYLVPQPTPVPSNNVFDQSARAMGSALRSAANAVSPRPYQAQPVYVSQPTYGQQAQPRLPPGWEQCIDPSSGRVFYKNHVNKTTSWTLPQ